MTDTPLCEDVQIELNGQCILIKADVFSALPYAKAITKWAELGGADVASGELDSSSTDLVLDYDAQQGLIAHWYQALGKKPLVFHLDYVKEAARTRSFPVPKQGAFNQALGKKSNAILDATGGWGGDAFLMSAQGYNVTILERNPVMALILREAFDRFAHAVRSHEWPVFAPAVHWGDGISAIASPREESDDKLNSELSGELNTDLGNAIGEEKISAFDCIYLDPMFPPKRKKSAATNKKMQLLHALVGQDLDADELLNATLRSGVKRVVVKRPDYATPLSGKPTQQFSSKLVHYDVYLSA